ncbi:related to PKR1 protein [Ramularia collo-cygni]|uniref:Related to PKR1 protein n=1 Tax=Ramularia collo-cygni TaxID=112498 RepID=A0A2D3UZ46_9PEZI|nr:related to PKR1 protein [Ramularia collo-cygni]CZT23327.1 related to PKR1 protein [Ramularia collo-cygni]
MADFITNLWQSVFTPGTTPTLLIATNATFACLQILLGGLLFATYSIHFAILSFLCGGLWYSINWFAYELQQAKGKEVEAERLRKKKREESEWRTKGDHADDEGEDTEVEGSGMRDSVSYEPTRLGETGQKLVVDDVTSSGQATSSGLQAKSGVVDARSRRAGDVGSSASEVSTDSEWEKVEDTR